MVGVMYSMGPCDARDPVISDMVKKESPCAV